MTTPSTQHLVSNTILQKKETEHFGEKADSRTGTGNTQMSLYHSVVPASKEVLKNKTKTHTDGHVAKGTGANCKNYQ